MACRSKLLTEDCYGCRFFAGGAEAEKLRVLVRDASTAPLRSVGFCMLGRRLRALLPERPLQPGPAPGVALLRRHGLLGPNEKPDRDFAPSQRRCGLLRTVAGQAALRWRRLLLIKLRGEAAAEEALSLPPRRRRRKASG